MKNRIFMAAIVSLMATVCYAQSFAGKWETAPPAAPAGGAAPAAGAAPAGGGGPGGGGRGGRGGGGQVIRLDLKVDGTKVSGSMFEGGADLVVTEGAVTGKQAKWHTIRQLNGADFRVNWTADMTDDNTISLSREFPNGIPARGGGGGGGGRGGPGGGGGAAAGGPPAGGAAVPAAGAAPAGGAPPAGGPGGGGRAGGGGGGRGGGGAIAPVTLKRVP